MSELTVGIDLGTTFSAIAYVDENGNPQIIPNAEGEKTTPSAVLIQDGRCVVGEVALNQWITNEEHVSRWIKREIGNADYKFQGLSPIEISAKILETLKADAARELTDTIRKAVITCPAYFAAVEIENTKRAGELAGLEVKEVVKEPTAAAVFYGVEHMKEGQTALICDLGGGTFDATLLVYKNGTFEARTSTGDRELGGHDWTTKLVDMVAERALQQFGIDPLNDLLAGQLLYQECEKAKRDFFRVPKTFISCQLEGRIEQIEVSRADFEKETESMMGRVFSCAEEALTKVDPPLTWKDLDRILLVGGSSRLRRLAEGLKQISGLEPTLVREPDLAVAFGAAIIARGKVRPRGLVEGTVGGLVEVVTSTRLPRSFGTRTIDWSGDKPTIRNTAIIEHGTIVPASVSREGFERASNQDTLEIPVIEFEPGSEFYELVGNYICKIPDNLRGGKIRVLFEYDHSSIASVRAFDQHSGAELPLVRNNSYEEKEPEAVVVRVSPRCVIFTIDISYSMDSGSKLETAKDVVIDKARELLNTGGGQCQIGVVTFGDVATVVCNPTTNFEAIRQAVVPIRVNGLTAMAAGIKCAMRLVLQTPTDTDRDIVMVTDGMPDDRLATLQAARSVQQNNIVLSSLGVGKFGVDKDYLNQLSPNSLVIENAEGISQGISTLLSMSEKKREGGLTE